MRKLYLIVLLLSLLTSCVSKRKFQTLEKELKSQKELYGNLSDILEKSRKNTADSERLRAMADAEIRSRETQMAAKDTKNKDLENQIEFLRSNNDKLLSQMSKWNETNKADSESIYKLIEQIEELNKFVKKSPLSKN